MISSKWEDHTRSWEMFRFPTGKAWANLAKHKPLVKVDLKLLLFPWESTHVTDKLNGTVSAK